MTALLIAVGAVVAFVTAAAAGLATLGRMLDRSRDWRLDHRSDRRQL